VNLSRKREGGCRHCGRWRKLEARGLCKTCFRRPEIRTGYARLRDSGNESRSPDYYGPVRREHGPLPGVQGSEERQAAYAERARRGVSLFG
jgi:hypothetical protein